jgi:hypothetical protein
MEYGEIDRCYWCSTSLATGDPRVLAALVPLQSGLPIHTYTVCQDPESCLLRQAVS